MSEAVAPPIEALVLDRDALIRLMRIALHEMHNRRLFTPQLTGEADIVQVIRYWDLVLDWIARHHAEDLLLMTRHEGRNR